MKENREENYLDAIHKIRRLLENYPDMGFYINQITEIVFIGREKVEKVLSKVDWAEKRGKRYYYKRGSIDDFSNMSFCEDVNFESDVKVEEDFSECSNHDRKKIDLLEDPEQLIRILRKERNITN